MRLIIHSLALSFLLIFWVFSPVSSLASYVVQPLATWKYPSSSPCNTTLQACINAAASGDTIQIAAGQYTESITLNKPVSLLGAGQATTVLKAPSGQRVLTITGGVITPATVISDLSIQGGNLTASACPAGCGAGILVTGGAQPSLQNLTVINNHSTAVGSAGGGVYADSGSALQLFYVTIQNNSAGKGGGAFAVNSLSMLGGRVEGNSAIQGDGGGLVVGSNSADQDTLSLYGAVVKNNSAQGSGGGVFAFRSASLTSAFFDTNKALVANGGGLYARSVTSTDTTFVNNVAAVSGGAIYVNNLVAHPGNADLTGGLLQSNQASASGGGIYAETPVSLTGTQVFSNTALTSGGGLFTSKATILLNADFRGNRCPGTLPNVPCDGGGIYAQSGLDVTDSQLLKNTAVGRGGGIYVSQGATLQGSLFQDNQASKGGTSLALCSGGAVFSGAGVNAENSIFKNNSASNLGGAIYSTGVSLGHSQALKNHSDSSGGAIYSTGRLELSWSDILTNTSGAQGGGAYVSLAATDIQDSNLNGNLSGTEGGGIYASGAITVTASTWIDNKTSNNKNGGALFVTGSGAAVITNNVMAGNDAVDGIAMELNTTGQVSVYNNTLTYPGIKYTQKGAVFILLGKANVLNNIFDGFQVGIWADPIVTGTQDYNLYNNYQLMAFGPLVGGGHNKAADPLFINPLQNNFHIPSASPAVDQAIDVGLKEDRDHQPRPFPALGSPDVGGYEWRTCIPAQTVTINGPATGPVQAMLLFNGVVNPTNSTEPLQYSWSPEPISGQGTSQAILVFASAEDHTIGLSVQSCGGVVSGSASVHVVEPGPRNVFLPIIKR